MDLRGFGTRGGDGSDEGIPLRNGGGQEAISD